MSGHLGIVAVRAPTLRRWWRELAFHAGGVALAVVAFVVVLPGLVLGAATLVLWVGLPVLAMTGVVAGWFAGLERTSCAAAFPGRPLAAADDRPSTGWRRVTDPQPWRDIVHAILGLPVRLATGLVAVGWSLGAVALSAFAGWEPTLARGDVSGLFGLVSGRDSRLGEIVVNTTLGLLALLIAPVLTHAMAVTRRAFAGALLADSPGALRARARSAEAGRDAASRAESATLSMLERDLHDGPQQRLVRLTMDLEAARRRIGADDPVAADTLMTEALAQSREVLAELRALSRGVAPPVLRERGLVAAVLAAAARCPVDTVVDTDIPQRSRYGEKVEASAYFVVTEALTNIAKHAGAEHAVVSLVETRDDVVVRVEDDGHGGAHVGKGHGLAGLEARLAATGGRLQVCSPVGGPTVVTAAVPHRTSGGS